MSFTVNLNRGWNADGEIIKVNESIFFIIEEAKETVLGFSQGNVQLFLFYFLL